MLEGYEGLCTLKAPHSFITEHRPDIFANMSVLKKNSFCRHQ